VYANYPPPGNETRKTITRSAQTIKFHLARENTNLLFDQVGEHLQMTPPQIDFDLLHSVAIYE
jgi:hypothetical protein